MLIPKSVFVSLPQPLCAFRLHEVSGCMQKNCNMHFRWRFHRHAGTHHEQAWIMYDASEPTHPVYHDCWTYISLIPVATIAPELCSILAGRACGSTMWPLTLRMSPSGLNSKNFGESVFRCRKIRPFACLWIRGGGVAYSSDYQMRSELLSIQTGDASLSLAWVISWNCSPLLAAFLVL